MSSSTAEPPPPPPGFAMYGPGPLKVDVHNFFRATGSGMASPEARRTRFQDIVGGLYTPSSVPPYGPLENVGVAGWRGYSEGHYYALRIGSPLALANGIGEPEPLITYEF